MLHTWANPDGTQRIEDTGPLTKKRMETVDEEFRDAAVDFIKRQHEAQTPFFVWFNTTHMHFRTHPKPESIGRAGRWQSEYHDTMLDHDDLVGEPARPARRTRPRRQHDRHVLHRQRPAHEHLARRRHDAVPQREELELGGRLPRAGDGALARRASRPARCSTESSATTTGSSRCWRRPVTPTSPTGCAPEPTWAAPPTRCTSTGTTSWTTSPAQTDESPRQHFFYVSDDGDLTALRYDNWKFVFLEQRCPGTLQIWAEPYTELRVPKIFNLRTDPYERADITSNTYYDWMLDHVFLFDPRAGLRRPDAADLRRVPAAAEVGQLQPRPGNGQAARRRRRTLLNRWHAGGDVP